MFADFEPPAQRRDSALSSTWSHLKIIKQLDQLSQQINFGVEAEYRVIFPILKSVKRFIQPSSILKRSM